jgi:outer membrane protein assembly factor BamB
MRLSLSIAVASVGGLLACSTLAVSDDTESAGYDPVAAALAEISSRDVGEHDWPQFFGWSHRNNTPHGENIPAEWDVESGTNVLWSAPLGSQTYGNVVVANGKVFVGTNNENSYISRFPKEVDLGCLLAFDEETGEFLWQHSNPKLPTGFVHDWPLQGVCAAGFVDGERLWYVNNRGEVVCLDTEGFHDDENDGPYTVEINQNRNEADIVWLFDMMGELGVSQHNMCSCSITGAGEMIFVCTSNGVDESHINIPAPDAPSFIAMDRNSGEVLWTDGSPGINILHGQWSSPTYAEIDGQAQVIFGGGDGWLYSFDPAGADGESKLLWKFDCNPKTALYSVRGRSERNHIIATPVVYDGLLYVAVGEDPEHGEGNGHLWCIDPTHKTDGSDVSAELALDADGEILPPRRLQNVDEEKGEQAVPNPDSAVVFHYTGGDINGNEKLEYEEQMHRSCGTVAIKDDILYICDFSGIVHCLNAKTGKGYWTYDMFSQSWGSPLVVDGKVYVGNEEGSLLVFEHSPEMNLLAENDMQNSVYSTPIVANNVLYITNKSTLFAIGDTGAQAGSPAGEGQTE